MPDDIGRLIDEDLGEALSKRYLAYALSTIMGRALPDARDGLKPVHRRLMYAMRQLKLDPASGYKKCARVVGDVIGRYHPHGDQAVYDALVRLAQDFAQRYPLIEGQGNFGNVDGDNAAAMRYTESRLTDAAMRLLAGLDQDAVDFRETYDGEDAEPIVLPGGFPNLLANGAAGIAVGMATSIPPHNVSEICDAALVLLARPAATTEDLRARMPGPDLPTGGIIVENEAALHTAYDTGRGSIRLRARWSTEEAGRGGYLIVVTEIPYQVQKARLIEQLASLIENKKAPLLDDVRDESAEDVRIVLEPKSRNVDPQALMESLFRQSDLENRLSVNMNVLVDGKSPQVLGLKALLQAWLDHLRDVLLRRSNFRLGKIAARLEILSGFMIVYLNLDEVIRIVRESDEPKAELMRTFALTDTQAEAVLNMRLRALRKLEEMELKREHEALQAEQAELQALVADPKAQTKRLTADLRELRKAYGPDTELGKRRTTFEEAPDIKDAPIEAFVVREAITVILSEKGWIKAVKGKVTDPAELKYKDGDSPAFAVPAETTDKILLLSSDGRCFTLGGDKLPSGRGFGEPVRLMIDLPDDTEIIALWKAEPGQKRLIASRGGYGFVIDDENMIASKKGGKQVLNVAGGDEAAVITPMVGDQLAMVSTLGRVLIFPHAELPEMGRGKGVKLMNLKGAKVSDVLMFATDDGAYWLDPAGRRHDWTDWQAWQGKRAQVGKLTPRGFPTAKRFTPKA